MIHKIQLLLLLTILGIANFSFSQSDLSRGLFAHYPFNGNANDIVGNNHGDVLGAAVQSGIRCGEDAYHFDGYKNYIDFGNSSDFNKIERGLTVSLWVYVEPKNKVGLSLLAGRWAFNKNQDQFGLFLGGKNTVAFSVGDGYVQEEGIFGKNMLQIHTWYHLVGVWRANGDMAIFINGELNNTGKQTGRGINQESKVTFKVGRQVEGADRPFKGYLDEVRVYERALSSREIKQLFDKDFATCNQLFVEGNVQDKNTGELLIADVIVEDMQTGEMVKKARVNPETMEYNIPLTVGKKYAIYASKEAYLPISSVVNTTGLLPESVIRRDLNMVPFKVGETVRLNNIFFDTGKSSLRPESYRELERVIKLFSCTPKLRIEINGHTDNVGSEMSNQTLSENRAKTVRDFLISKNLSPDKVTFVGLGESLPIANNDSDDGRQLNRRVEFKILDL
ncbi:MAG: LamG-like jellyroll fold domain-containing protein [Bacteroidota bacterium]